MPECLPTLLPGLRERLLQRLDALHRELDAADLARQSDRWLDSHEVSDLKDIVERRLWTDQISAQERRDRAEVADVEAALKRLAAGQYGMCKDCDEPIASERLHVQPAAPRCAPCQAAHERAAHPHSHLRM